jgi:hypothetical protein
MFRWFNEWIRARRLAPVRAWRCRVAETLVADVFAPGTPFQYETALSFLQPETFVAADPIRVALFLPEWPLAIDLLGPDTSNSFATAAPFIERPRWEIEQERLALKQRVFAQYNCPYLQLWNDEAVDPFSLAERIKNLTGAPPR